MPLWLLFELEHPEIPRLMRVAVGIHLNDIDEAIDLLSRAHNIFERLGYKKEREIISIALRRAQKRRKEEQYNPD